MDDLYLVVWEDEDSMDHGIHGGYTDVDLALHTARTMDDANATRNYELKKTLLVTKKLDD